LTVTSLITLPARLGFEAARRTLDLAAGAGRLVGLVGSAEPAVKTRTRRPRPPKPGMDDNTLARKVETQIFRVGGVAKGKIAVNAADGVVWLRGEAKTPALIKRVEAKAASIPEVKRVENLLHLPKTPARRRTSRAKTSGRAATRGGNGASATAAPAPTQAEEATLTRKVESQIFREGYAPKGSVSVTEADGVVRLSGRVKSPDDVRELQRRALSVPGVKRVENELVLPEPPAAEPLQHDLADRGEGRQPAPLGASDEAPGSGAGGDARTTIP
jgi:osmotically-inducible protein OsmY